MQALYFRDMHPEKLSIEDFVKLFCEHYNESLSSEVEPFFFELINGVLENRSSIDTLIEENSSNWKISRMSGIDRNVMRVAVFEINYCSDIPEKVSINEAIDIGKKFGTRESGPFINGILDSIYLKKG